MSFLIPHVYWDTLNFLDVCQLISPLPPGERVALKPPFCCTVSILQSPKFKRVSLNETLEFPFWGLKICVDFDLRDSKKMENIKKINEKYFINKNIDIHKTT